MSDLPFSQPVEQPPKASIPPRWFIFVGLFVLVVGITAVFLWLNREHTFSGLVQTPAPPANDFTLTDQTGQPFSLSDYRGQWILLAYGYTTCPDICPATLATIKRTESMLGESADNVKVVFVSVDPARDTPEVMGKYVAHFGDDYKGLSGTEEEVATAAQAYGAKYEMQEVDSAAVYLVNHSAYIYVISPEFKLVETFPFGVTPQMMVDDLTYMMETMEEE